MNPEGEKAAQGNQVIIRISLRLILTTLSILASSINLYWRKGGRKSCSFLKPFHEALKSKTKSSVWQLSA